MKAAPLMNGSPVFQCRSCKGYFTKYNASTDACDMVDGPCACGAWHFEGDWECVVCRRASKGPCRSCLGTGHCECGEEKCGEWHQGGCPRCGGSGLEQDSDT